MGSKKEELFDEVTFADVAIAQAYLSEYNNNAQRRKIGLIVAAVAPVIDLLLTFLIAGGVNPTVLFFVGIIVAVAAYIVGGGLSSAVKFALKISKIAYYLGIIFPINLVLMFFALVFSFVAVIFLPIVVVGYTQFGLKRNKDIAVQFLNSVGCDVNAVNPTVSSETTVGQNTQYRPSQQVNASTAETCYCTSCGAKIDANSKFCIKCGAKQD